MTLLSFISFKIFNAWMQNNDVFLASSSPYPVLFQLSAEPGCISESCYPVNVWQTTRQWKGNPSSLMWWRDSARGKPLHQPSSWVSITANSEQVFALQVKEVIVSFFILMEQGKCTREVIQCANSNLIS